MVACSRWTQHVLFCDPCQHQLSKWRKFSKLIIPLKDFSFNALCPNLLWENHVFLGRVFNSQPDIVLTLNLSRAFRISRQSLSAFLAQNSLCERVPFLLTSSSSNKAPQFLSSMFSFNLMCSMNSARLTLWSLSPSAFLNILI